MVILDHVDTWPEMINYTIFLNELLFVSLLNLFFIFPVSRNYQILSCKTLPNHQHPSLIQILRYITCCCFKSWYVLMCLKIGFIIITTNFLSTLFTPYHLQRIFFYNHWRNIYYVPWKLLLLALCYYKEKVKHILIFF